MKKNNGGFYRNAGVTDDNKSNGRESDAFSREEEVKRAADRYAGMSEDALLDQLFAEASFARRRGELDDAKLDVFYNSVKGSLSPSQLKKLDVLMKALKSK